MGKLKNTLLVLMAPFIWIGRGLTAFGKAFFRRQVLANFAMFAAIVLIGLGAALQFGLGIGLIAAGAGLGTFAYLLGAE